MKEVVFALGFPKLYICVSDSVLEGLSIVQNAVMKRQEGWRGQRS